MRWKSLREGNPPNTPKALKIVEALVPSACLLNFGVCHKRRYNPKENDE
jgi:hypothetical protein